MALDLLDGRHLAQPGNVGIEEVGEPPFQHCLGAVEEVGLLAPIEPDNVGEELMLFGREVAVGPVDLAVDGAGVDEQYLVGPFSILLTFVEEPQRDGQGDGVEEVRPDRHHHVRLAVFDQLAPDRQLGVADVRCRVGHDEASPPGLVERRRKDLDPQVVAVIYRRDAVRVALVVLEPVLVDGVDIEWRIGDHEVEAAHRVVLIFVVRVGLDDLATEAVDGQVHLGEADRLFHPLLAEDRDVARRVLLVLLYEAGRLHEHAARSAGGVEDTSLERLDDVDDQLDDRGRGEELASPLALRESEVGQEVLVDLPEGVTLDVVGNGPDQPQEFGQHRIVEAGVVAGQHSSQVGVLGFDGLHCPVERRSQVCALGQPLHVRVPSRLRHVHDAPGLVVGLPDLTPTGCPAGQFLLHLGEAHIGVAEEDKAQHRYRVLRGGKRRVGAQLVGRFPEAVFEFMESFGLSHDALACGELLRSTLITVAPPTVLVFTST